MMSRCITQFHKPAECSAACFEAEQVTKELKALANSIEKNESPDEIRSRIEKDSGPLITYPQITPHKYSPVVPKPPEEEYYPPWRRPRINSRQLIAGFVEKGCSCSKRNGLQDDCKRPGCGGPACLAKPKPLCDPCGVWKKQVTPEEAKQLMDTLKPIQPPICNAAEACNPDCEMCRGPFGDTAKTLVGCPTRTQTCKHGDANLTRDFYLLPVNSIVKKH